MKKNSIKEKKKVSRDKKIKLEISKIFFKKYIEIIFLIFKIYFIYNHIKIL